MITTPEEADDFDPVVKLQPVREIKYRLIPVTMTDTREKFLQQIAKELNGRRFYHMIYPALNSGRILEFNESGKHLGTWSPKKKTL